ncbi:TPA: CII family transcriptional regulator [Yersinia enterocolitica]
MERATTRNKARIIESQLLNKIALRGVTDIADAVGVDKSQISRWKESFIPKISMLLAVLEWGVVDDEMARLAKSVALLLTKQKSQQKGRDSEQITINF